MPHSIRAACAAVVLVACTSTNGEDGAAPPDDAGPIDATPLPCPAACGEWHECVDGGVIAHTEAVNYCDPNKTCVQTLVHSCSDGCAVEGASLSIIVAPSAMCEETPSKQVGDSCRYDHDCLPVRAAPTPDGGLVTTHLECDLDDTCKEAEGPMLADWMQPCALVTFQPESDAPGTISVAHPEARECEELCVYANDPAAGCVRSGCSWPCNGDHDCPSGAFCDDTIPSDHHFGGGVCKFGPGDNFTGYDCPSCACDRRAHHCDAAADASVDECECDPDCSEPGNQACETDFAYCDTWCDPDSQCADRDCNKDMRTGECVPRPP